jgi:hypothetical protein
MRHIGRCELVSNCREARRRDHWPAQTVLMAKRFHSLSATCLLGNQPSPLRPRSPSTLGHVATLRCDTLFFKMGFV